MMLAFSLLQGTFALFTEHTLHLSAEQNGYLFAYLGLVGIIIQLFLLKRIIRLIPENKIVVIGILMMAISLLLVAFGGNIPFLLVAITLLAFANGISNPILAGLVSKLSPDDEQGNIMGISQSVGSIARMIGPIVGTIIYAELGAQSPYLFGAITLILTAIFAARYLKDPSLIEQVKAKIHNVLQH